MNLETAVNYVESQLTEYCLKKELNDQPYNVDYNFIEPCLVFLSQQTDGTPFGALVGALVGSKQELLKDAAYFVEAVCEHQIVRIGKVNGNWIVYPVKIEHEVGKALGCSNMPIDINPRNAFCGKTLHKPMLSRMDHLALMNSISFEINQEFVSENPEIPEDVPFIKTLPNILETADKLHIEHKYDTRGRTYSASHINYQGTEYEKCLLRFSKKTPLTEEGMKNICNYHEGLKPSEHYLKASAVQGFVEGVTEATGIFIGADASASGTQLMSVLRGCEVSAKSVGLTSKSDFYTLAAQESQLTVRQGEDSRSVFKECCMQHFYGGVKTPKERLGKHNLPKFYGTLDKIAPGCQLLLKELQAIYWETPIFKWTLPDGFKVQQPVITTERIELSLPNNPDVKFGYAYKSLVVKDKGLEMAANVVHSVDGYVARELIYRAYWVNQGISASYVDHLRDLLKHNKAVLIKENKPFCFYKLHTTPVEKWPLFGKRFLEKALAFMERSKGIPSFNVISIHDDFKCHPNYLLWVKFLYMEILADIADSNLIKSIVEEINPTLKYEHVGNPKLAQDIRDSFDNGTGDGLK